MKNFAQSENEHWTRAPDCSAESDLIRFERSPSEGAEAERLLLGAKEGEEEGGAREELYSMGIGAIEVTEGAAEGCIITGIETEGELAEVDEAELEVVTDEDEGPKSCEKTEARGGGPEEADWGWIDQNFLQQFDNTELVLIAGDIADCCIN